MKDIKKFNGSPFCCWEHAKRRFLPGIHRVDEVFSNSRQFGLERLALLVAIVVSCNVKIVKKAIDSFILIWTTGRRYVHLLNNTITWFSWVISFWSSSSLTVSNASSFDWHRRECKARTKNSTTGDNSESANFILSNALEQRVEKREKTGGSCLLVRIQTPQVDRLQVDCKLSRSIRDGKTLWHLSCGFSRCVRFSVAFFRPWMSRNPSSAWKSMKAKQSSRPRS